MKRCEEAGHRFGGFVPVPTGWVRRCRRRSCSIVAFVSAEMAAEAVKAGQVRVVRARRTGRYLLAKP
jgi:hypothetical protein